MAGEGVKSFRELEVYKKAYAVLLEIHKASLGFPKIEQYALADQLRRASKPICGNIAEGFAKQRASKAEFKRFLLMSLGSANEVLVWLDYCADMGYVANDTVGRWNEEYVSVCKMLNAFISRV